MTEIYALATGRRMAASVLWRRHRYWWWHGMSHISSRLISIMPEPLSLVPLIAVVFYDNDLVHLMSRGKMLVQSNGSLAYSGRHQTG
jgi:hypothetical protein